jgi:hypothetical protein
MKSKHFIRTKLVNYTNADCSDVEAKNNRYHYSLKFEEDIGWDWMYSQIKKCEAELGVALEPYKLRPSGMSAFEVEVREVDRREGIDDDQRGLKEWE